METQTLLLASAFISVLVAALFLWLGCSWIGTRLKTEIQHEYDQKLVALRAHWEARDETQRLQMLAPERQRRTEVLMELCSRWMPVGASIEEIGNLQRGAVERSRFGYQETFRKELGYFDDYFRTRRAFLDGEAAGTVADAVSRMRAAELELTATLRDEENVDAAGAVREIHKTFEGMSGRAATVTDLLEARCRAALGV